VEVEDKSSVSEEEDKSSESEENFNVLIFVLMFQVCMDVSAFTLPPSLFQLFAPFFCQDLVLILLCLWLLFNALSSYTSMTE